MNTPKKSRSVHATLRLMPWLLSLATMTVGLWLLLARTVYSDYEIAPNEWSSDAYDVTGIGLALLCTGILALTLTLLAETHLRRDSQAQYPTNSGE